MMLMHTKMYCNLWESVQFMDNVIHLTTTTQQTKGDGTTKFANNGAKWNWRKKLIGNGILGQISIPSIIPTTSIETFRAKVVMVAEVTQTSSALKT
jgi:hypothetical protein